MHREPPDKTGPPPVEVRNLWVTLGGQNVLQGINLSVPAGQLVALIGPNGSGKTTLLRALVGLQKPATGEIKLFGQTKLDSVLPRIGYVPQRFNLESSFILTVREFLALRLRATRHWFWQSRARVDERICASLADVGVEA